MVRRRAMIGTAMPIDGAQLAGFIAVAALLVGTPGPNTVLILTNSVAGGRSAGMATVLGVETGTLVHTIASAAGISVLLASSALAFDVMKYVGSAYLACLGLRAFVSRGHSLPELRESSTPPWRTFRQALLTSVLNPKAAMFFLALLPQFVRREQGHVASQFIVLGATVAVIGLAFGFLLTVSASRAHKWLRHGVVARWRARLTGSVLIGLSVRLAFTQRS